MTHDPLCRSMFHHYYEDYPCDCDICQSSCDCKRVAKIRADTLSKVREVVSHFEMTTRWLDRTETSTDAVETMRDKPSWNLTHRITTGPIRRITS